MAEVSQGYFYDENGQRVNIDFFSAADRETLNTHTNHLDNIDDEIDRIKDEELAYAEQYQNNTFDGRNLLEVFDAEIANGYANAWEWLADHVSLRKSIGRKAYKGLRVGDYIPMPYLSYTIPQHISAFDYDEGCTDIEQPPAIFMQAGAVVDDPIPWNTANVNQGNATNAAPYMVSNVKAKLESVVLPNYPATVRAVMGSRRALIETRYQAGQTLSESGGWAWNDLGRLWLPSESEVYGQCVWSTPSRADGMGCQFEIFRNPRNWVFRDSNGERRTVWLRSVMSGSSANVCYVNGYGNATSYSASVASVCVAPGFKVVGE